MIIVRGEEDITWAPIVPELLKHVTGFGAVPSILEVSEFSFPNFKKPPRWVVERYSLWSENKQTRDFLESIELEFSEIDLRSSKIPEEDLQELERSVTSMLITLFGDTRPKRHRILEPSLRSRAINSSRDLYLRASRRFAGLGNLTVVIPNGRFPYQKAADLAARRAGASVLYYERGFLPEKGFYLGHFPTQDREAWQGRAKTRWDGSENWSSLDRARDWFKQRRSPNSESNEYSRYWGSGNDLNRGAQISQRVSVAFFTSSQDEYLVLDGWEGFGWADQYTAFSTFSSRISGNKVLRVHPNFINKSFGQACEEMKRIMWFAKQEKDLKIVWPIDDVNSYVLMEESDRVFVHGSTVGLEASANSKSVWTSGNAIYDTYADVRRFEPNTEYDSSYFDPWIVNEIKSLQIVEEMIHADVPFTKGIKPPKWSSSTIPLHVRIYNLILVGSASYTILLIQKNISIWANKILVFLFRNLILRKNNYG